MTTDNLDTYLLTQARKGRFVPVILPFEDELTNLLDTPFEYWPQTHSMIDEAVTQCGCCGHYICINS